MKTFEEWFDYAQFSATMEDCWNASAENSAEETAKRDERIAELSELLNSHGPEGHNWANAQVVAIREIMHSQSARIKELEFFQAQHIEKIDEQAERIASLIAAGAEYQRQFFEQSDQIKELSEDRDTWEARTEFSFQQRDELAAQNQQLREALTKIGEVASPYRAGMKFNYIADLAQDALALPDLASQHLNRVKAETIRDLAVKFYHDPEVIREIEQSPEGLNTSEWLLRMADAIEKGEG